MTAREGGSLRNIHLAIGAPPPMAGRANTKIGKGALIGVSRGKDAAHGLQLALGASPDEKRTSGPCLPCFGKGFFKGTLPEDAYRHAYCLTSDLRYRVDQVLGSVAHWTWGIGDYYC